MSAGAESLLRFLGIVVLIDDMSQHPSAASYQDKLQELQARYPDAEINWNYEHNVSICERSKTVIEPLISEEFFLSYSNEFAHPSCDDTKYLIFDYDGVLANSGEANLAYWVAFRADGDYQKARQMREEYFEKPGHRRSQIEESANHENMIPGACEFMRDYDFDLFDEFLEEIASISNAKLAIVSNGIKELIILPKLRRCKVNFTHVLGQEDHHSKAEKVARVCKDWGISPKQAYYFTDTKADVLELQDCMDKTKIIGCSWGWTAKSKLLEVLPESQILDKFVDIHRLFGPKTNLQKLTLKGLDETQFFPAEYKDLGQNFIQNVRDWCISRDLTWGHKIPVWYNLQTNPERQFYSYQEWLRSPAVRAAFQVSASRPTLPGEWVQETKILDTWFSSALWPLSTLDFVETVKPNKTVILIGGGEVFDTEAAMLAALQQREIDIRQPKVDWKVNLQHKLTAAGIEVFVPQMPNKQNARYQAWKIWFEKYLEQIDPESQLFLVGHSLGGNFLLKYLSENSLKVKQLHLVAACSREPTFEVSDRLDLIMQNCERVCIYYSTDDPVVPLEQSAWIAAKLPGSQQFMFENRGHFTIPYFPEIEEYILYSDYFYVFSKYFDLNGSFQTRIATHGIIYNPNTKKLLLGKIDQDLVKNVSQKSIQYHLIGGKIEPGETPKQAFLREFEEETGISRSQLTKLELVGRGYFGSSFQRDFGIQNIRLESSLFYAETTSERADWTVDYQISKWVDLADVQGKMVADFEKYIELVLNQFSSNFRSDLVDPTLRRNLAKKTDFEQFYPTQTMVTAKEIFYLWIVRMITLGKYFTNRTPFEALVITPTILDEKGRKMSKSLKNGLEPVGAIERFSSDALRLAMLSGMIPGRNMRFGGNLADRLMEKYRNFGNKVWNVARFLESKIGGLATDSQGAGENLLDAQVSGPQAMPAVPAKVSPESLAPASVWILQKYLELQDTLQVHLQTYELAHAVEALYEFLWDHFADWYVEYLKTDETQLAFASQLFRQFIITLSPFAPFETEVLWSEFFGQTGLLAFATKNDRDYHQLWQQIDDNHKKAEEFATVINFIQDLRSTRGLFAIDPGKVIRVYSPSELLGKYAKFARLLAKMEVVAEPAPAGCYKVVKPDYEYALEIVEFIADKNAEIARTKKMLAALDQQIATLEMQLANPDFLVKADPEVVAAKQSDLKQRQAEKIGQETKLAFLQSL